MQLLLLLFFLLTLIDSDLMNEQTQPFITYRREKKKTLLIQLYLTNEMNLIFIFI